MGRKVVKCFNKYRSINKQFKKSLFMQNVRAEIQNKMYNSQSSIELIIILQKFTEYSSLSKSTSKFDEDSLQFLVGPDFFAKLHAWIFICGTKISKSLYYLF